MGKAVYQVKLDTFEGPLDLLLHLVNQYEIDIYDVPLREITDQYMNYIHTMQDLQLDIASEYLVMAATLLAIKSQMLLPKQDLDVEDEYEEDPREELIQRLIEYRKYKQASQELKEREMESNQIFTRSPADLSEYESTVKVTQSEELTIVDLAQAFQKVLRRKKLLEPLETTIQRQEISIDDRMDQVVDQLKKSNGKKKFEDLFQYSEKFEIVATFLALLELMKSVKITCYQTSNFDDIMVELMEA
ncbi:segregation/condensation protein A [Tenuibacillus multivorans]|uniref:Segregation and condensation protein A n=1 Tax=Tenuibacillus multivorans TaxID=237069 RepID=A0A1H0CYX1_9BACI|nr:segregation/condensation protein A [Tenuibacillus multivorans]GEL76113.1 segregation and condensation protein A [Tenuibacillus multivorans]SDN62996.1 condensin subunit ScpA [Tenuibacillus multivorans]